MLKYARRKRYLRQFLICLVVMGMEICIVTGLQVYIFVQIDRQEDKKQTAGRVQEAIWKDLQYFPIPAAYQEEVTYEDSYGAARVQGGHEGCDITDVQNREGYLPVISATDGVITNAGWIYLGGYRVGITAESGIYYYYAHLASYANGIVAGKEIHAGQLIGFMGSTGEGEEGTLGKFPVHLHFGIYVTTKNKKEYTVDPYTYLLELEER